MPLRALDFESSASTVPPLGRLQASIAGEIAFAKNCGECQISGASDRKLETFGTRFASPRAFGVNKMVVACSQNTFHPHLRLAVADIDGGIPRLHVCIPIVACGRIGAVVALPFWMVRT